MTRSSRGARDHDRDTQFDILSPRFHADPFPTLDRMRAEAPVVRVKLPICPRVIAIETGSSRVTSLRMCTRGHADAGFFFGLADCEALPRACPGYEHAVGHAVSLRRYRRAGRKA
jgi:hypothetical protein